nr:hypothetical protein CFP56_30219 [Quercus suber]
MISKKAHLASSDRGHLSRWPTSLLHTGHPPWEVQEACKTFLTYFVRDDPPERGDSLLQISSVAGYLVLMVMERVQCVYSTAETHYAQFDLTANQHITHQDPSAMRYRQVEAQRSLLIT